MPSPPPPPPPPPPGPPGAGGDKPSEGPAGSIGDIHRTPTGSMPAAWKDLPPTEIVRAPKEEPKEGLEGFKQRVVEFLKTRAALQIGVLILAAVGMLVIWHSFQPKYTLESHGGAIRMFCEGLEERDFAKMRKTTIGQATTMCEMVLETIARMERDGGASRFVKAAPHYGGAPPGSLVASAQVVCRGENGDSFLEINMSLQRQEDRTWRIAEMGLSELR